MTLQVNGGDAGMPDMTFRLDRKEIERIMGQSARGSAPQLVQLSPESEKNTRVLDGAYYVMGKDETATIRLGGFLCPAKAAVIVRTDHGFRLVALSKRVRVNGKSVSDTPLTDGDEIRFGSCKFRFCVV